MFNDHLMKACLAAVFAIGFTACGSSGSGTASMPDRELTGPTAPMPDPGPTQEEQQLADLQQLIAALRAQLGITGTDDTIGDSITALMNDRDRLQQQIDDEAEEAQRKAAEAAVAAAAKLYVGIRGTSLGGEDSPATHRVSVGDGTVGISIESRDTEFVSEDKETPIADQRGWEGKKYMEVLAADTGYGGMHELVVYRNFSEPGKKKFGGPAANGEFEYQLINGALPSTTAWVAERVAFTGVTRTAGTETFSLPDPIPGGLTEIRVPGSYHGVSGTYSCTPAAPANGCSASVAVEGFTLSSGDTWTFTPTDPNARVRTPRTSYASYGWWIYTPAIGNPGRFRVTAFADDFGSDRSASGLDTLYGTATYVGGAAGIYALTSLTGGLNDAGPFTADATLEANFTDNMISGTIDNLMGADGMSRDWSIELKEAGFADDGAIVRTDANDTVWTIGGTAAAASGEWSGYLYNNGADGVPKVVNGVFDSTYGHEGRIVGGFGADRE